MSLEHVVEALRIGGTIDPALLDGWAADQAEKAEKVALYRDYVAGDHPQELTDAMRRMMRVRADSPMQEFCLNYMDIVVQTLADRLRVAAMDATGEAVREWAADRMAANGFDGLQGDVHEAALTDGDTFVLAYFDPAARRVLWSHEPAFDGENGMLIWYDSANDLQPSAAIKTWRTGDAVRVTVYYADRVERYISTQSGLAAYDTDDQPAVAAWMQTNGSALRVPIGVPVVHFRNRARRWGSASGTHGTSEIETAIPIQNALNRTLYSMVMAAELSAFQIRYAVGWQPPADLAPGMWVTISPDRPLDRDERIEIGTLAQGELMPYLDMARYLAAEIGRITRTPSPEFGWEMASGESLKQREIGLIGKARRFQVKAGEAWSRLFSLTARIEGAFLPQTSGDLTHAVFRPQWASVDVRSE